MTALVPREVERTFSEVSSFLAGLPHLKPNHTDSQNFPELG